MKAIRNILLVILFITGGNGNTFSQWVTIPDANFLVWLNNNGYSSCLNGNQLDTTCNLVVNATKIDCGNSMIADLEGVQYFDNLDTLLCNDNQLTSLPALPNTLKLLHCDNNPLGSLPALPNSLTALGCRYCQLSTLPPLPSGLGFMNVDNNQLTSLPVLPNSLSSLWCQFNQITALPNVPTSMYSLYCRSNQLQSLPPLPAGIYELHCMNNQLDSLPTFPSSLKRLWCDFNNLTSLPAINTNLQTLTCSNNLLTSLPTITNSIWTLDISSNPLPALPIFPNSLSALNISHLGLTSLPSLPPALYSFDCSFNQLTSIPPLPSNIHILHCSNNLLFSLPDLPLTTQNVSIWCNANPNLTCLPELGILYLIRFDSTAVQCLPNYGVVNSSYPLLTSLPLCDIFNTNNCAFYYNISGHVFADLDSNCVDDPGENTVPYIKINLFQSGNLVQQQYTSQAGLYSVNTQLGTFDYTVDTLDMPYFVGCPPSGMRTSVLTSTDSTDTGMDFGLQCRPGHDVGVRAVTHFTGKFFPGDTALIRVDAGDLSSYFNLDCASGVSGTLQITFSGPVQYAGPVSGSLIPVSNPGSITYSINDFGTINNLTDFRFMLATDTNAVTGQPVCLSVDVLPLSGDNRPSNNQLTHCFSVQNSFDPNAKEVSPVSNISPDEQWLTYTIYFQNTGTASAQHIIVTDTLDSDLREETFSYLDASHNVFVNVTGNVVKFTFPNINLPDSISNEPGSHGWIQYKIKTKPNLALGTTIENSANIYFDFNPHVITNATVNTVVNSTSIAEFTNFSFGIFPNPTNGKLNITTNMEGSKSLNIYDVSGRVLMNHLFAEHETTIDVSSLASGFYVVEIMGNGKHNLQKVLIKQ